MKSNNLFGVAGVVTSPIDRSASLLFSHHATWALPAVRRSLGF